MLPKVVKEWLSEYKTLSKEEIHSYAASIRHNVDLVKGLQSLFEEHCEVETLDPVCNQLFEFYRSSEQELQRFTLEVIPTLIWLYLSLLSKGDKKSCGAVEAFLLAIYNLETCSRDGQPKEKTSRIPSFSQHSIYHEPVNLTEAILSRHHTEPGLWKGGPYPQYESVNGQNRHEILSYLLQAFNTDIANLSSRAQKTFCQMCSRIVTTGFHNLIQPDDEGMDDTTMSTIDHTALRRMSHSGEMLSRIAVSPALLIDMLSGLYYAMFNGQAGPAAQAVVDIHNRASYQLFADVLLVTNAIRNSLRENPSGHPEDGPIGISLALTPASSNYTLSKSAITNASFRAQKLPDDITVQPDDAQKLATIDEDSDPANKSKGWKGKLPKKDKGDKSRLKEMRSSDGVIKGGHQQQPPSQVLNGDSSIMSDGVQVSVIRNSTRTGVDVVEMQGLNSSRSSSGLDDQSSSPFISRTASPGGKLSGIRSSISNKDIKNAKSSAASHVRSASGGSGNSDTQSTDL